MANEDLEAADIERKVHNLAEAMERVRSAQVERDDVVVDMKHSKISRLELLAGDLATVFNELPPEIEMFEFAITNGEVPRFWIDMTSFVRMGADGREYEFVKDTRLGRTILARSTDREQVGKVITDYVAQRVLERERMIEGDWLSMRRQFAGTGEGAGTPDGDDGRGQTGQDGADARGVSQADGDKARFPWISLTVLAIVAALFILGYNDQLEPAMEWLRQQAPGLFPPETGADPS